MGGDSGSLLKRNGSSCIHPSETFTDIWDCNHLTAELRDILGVLRSGNCPILGFSDMYRYGEISKTVLGPVFQSILSLTNSLRGQLIKSFTTL